MTMRFASIICLTFSILGCSESSTQRLPTEPTASPVTTPPPQLNPLLYPPESWTLTASITSVTPHPCWRDLTGLTYDYKLIVRRAEAMRLSVYWDPTDGIEYVGSHSGQDFSVAGNFNRGNSFSMGCASGGQVEVILSGRVSGRLSDDGRSISAEEVLSYLYVRTGEQVDVRYRWTATAPA
jgi:hypothetical protein